MRRMKKCLILSDSLKKRKFYLWNNASGLARGSAEPIRSLSEVLPNTLNPIGPTFFGHVSGPLPRPLLSRYWFGLNCPYETRLQHGKPTSMFQCCFCWGVSNLLADCLGVWEESPFPFFLREEGQESVFRLDWLYPERPSARLQGAWGFRSLDVIASANQNLDMLVLITNNPTLQVLCVSHRGVSFST